MPIIYALHLAKPDAPPLGIWRYSISPSTPAEAEALTGSVFAWRRKQAAGSFIPGASRIMPDDVERMIANGRMSRMSEDDFGAWAIEPLQASIFLTAEAVQAMQEGDSTIPIQCAVSLTRITRPGGAYLEAASIGASYFSDGFGLHAEEAVSTMQFQRIKAAEKQLETWLTHHRTRLDRNLSRAKMIEVAPAELTREALLVALGDELEKARARAEREREAAREAKRKLAEEERRKRERLERNPAAGMSDEELAEQLRRMRKGSA